MQALTYPPMDPYRMRVLEGFSAAIGEKGYAATTIADIVRHARLSKRTFYEHFPDKESCFLAAYGAAAEVTLGVIESAANPDLPWREQIHTAAHAYVVALESRPAETRTFMLEVHAAGPRALALRDRIHERFADRLRALVAVTRRRHPHLQPLSPAMARAIVGGINELVLVALGSGSPAKLRALAKTATELLVAVLVAKPER